MSGGSRCSGRPLDHLQDFALSSRRLLVAPVEFQDGRDPDLGDGLLGFVLNVLASAELALDLDVITLPESGGEGSQPTENDGAMPFRSRSSFAGFAVLRGVLGRQREG
jgi:hypothetical protein